MANSCVNINSKEFVDLHRQVNMNPSILAAKVSLWQDKNGIDNFPTKEDLSLEQVQDSKGIEMKASASRKIEEAFDGFYSRQASFERTEKHIDFLADGKTDSVATTEDKIERMQRSLDAVVMIDTDLPLSGRLLGINNPISKANGGKPIILINPELAFADTVFHEFGHLYIDMLGGMADPKVAEAIEFLKGTKLWYAVEDQYPELTPDQLAKEVLATALGVETDLIYSGNQEKKSIWQKIKTALLNVVNALFGNKKTLSALEQLATEMLTGDTRISSTAKFNTLIDQNSRLNLEKPTQENIDKLFKELNRRFRKKEEGNIRFYEDVDDNNKYTKSVSEFSKSMTSQLFVTRKGDIDMPFSVELTPSNFEMIINSSSIPYALDRALGDFFEGTLEGRPSVQSTKSEYWYDYYSKFLRDQSSGGIVLSNLTDQIEENLEVINERAKEIEEERKLPIQAGNIVHKALEDFINEGIPFPSNVIDKEGDLLKLIEKLITEGKKNGSKFYTEQTLFSQSAKVPGTADLIEITKDGQFRIYDFKTMTSFLNTRTGQRKTIWDMYINSGYLNQILIYSTMLREYGIQPADNHLNIISMEVDRDQMTADDPESIVVVNRIINKNINSKDPDFQNYIINANNRIIGQFRNPDKLKEFNIKNEERNIDELVEKLHRAVKDLRKQYKNTPETSKENRIFRELDGKMEELMGVKNKQVLLSYIKNMREALHIVYAYSSNNEAYLTPEYLRNLEFLRQATTFITDIRFFVTSQDKNTIKDRDEILNLLDETEKVASDLLKVQRLKEKELAVRILAENSTFMDGLFAEKYEIEARKTLNKPTKAQIDEYVYNKLKENALEIQVAEQNYWANIFRNGYTDIRYLEWLIADPGMNKSQFVQVTKNVMDKVDMFKRIDLDNSIADLVAWHDGLTIDKTGDPKKIWGKFMETAEYTDEKGKKHSYMDYTLISELTSDWREGYLAYRRQRDYYERLLSRAKRKNDSKEYDRIVEILKALSEQRPKDLDKLDKTTRVNPKFAALSKAEQEALKYIHEKLEKADERLNKRPTAKLVIKDEGVSIHSLPRQRKSELEAIYAGEGKLKRFVSGIRDFVRPPADADDINITSDEAGLDNELHTSSTDILGDPLYEIPVFYRRTLEDPELQSFDIPTLLAMNEDTTIQFEHFSSIEADLFMITQALKDTKALKTDTIVNKQITDRLKGGLAKTLKSEGNRVLDAVQASINNRFYKRTYAGVYSKANYRLIKGAEALNSFTGKLLLAGNFGSGAMTATQGTIYRFIEGIAGEDYSMSHVKEGSRRAWWDYHNVVADYQRQFPKSKTMLLIRRFGLDTQYHALVNKFVQDNILAKNLDEGAFYAVTNVAETIVTASLMYTLMNNIKVMNSKGDYIDVNGNKVSKDKAMTLDDAYIVKDGKLELNEHVAYTERNLTHRFRDTINGEKTLAATEIGGFIRSKYADLYGQYNQDLKSVAEMHWWGKLAFSMKKWIPRGYHRRWRGINSVRQTFEEMREEQNLEKRFYSQDQRKFQEGYYTTGIRYVYTLMQELRNKQISFMMAVRNVNDTLSTHDRANIKRLRSEIAVILGSLAAALFLRAIALGLDDDDEDRDMVYFAAYLAERINIESNTFWNPFELVDNIQNPAAAINTLNSTRKLLHSLFGLSYNKDMGAWDLEINNVYERGNRKGELKVLRNMEVLIPYYKKTSQLWGILGYDSKESIKDSYEYMIR